MDADGAVACLVLARFIMAMDGLVTGGPDEEEVFPDDGESSSRPTRPGMGEGYNLAATDIVILFLAPLNG